MTEFLSPRPKGLISLDSGPLAPHLDNFAALLARQGYSSRSAWRKLSLAACFGRWLAQQHLEIEELDQSQVNAFLDFRRRTRGGVAGEPGTLMALLGDLRRAGVIPAPEPPVVREFTDRLGRDYEQFLLHERGLAPQTVAGYLPVVRRFLQHRFPTGRIRLRQLRAGDAADFILHSTTGYGRRYLQSATYTLRSFLGFLLQRGRITVPLAHAVPTVAGWRLSELPCFLETAQVEKLLRSRDRRQSLGRRDYAILLLLARLGLRGGEVARLCLEDIDWSAGELRIHGKGPRLDGLPLPHDVGQAIADYLKTRRTGESCRRVFLGSKAPYAGFSGSSVVANVVRRALGRAQLHPHHRGAHLLRHSLATRMLRAGASLAQIGQVLRHQQAQTTAIYAKVDVRALRRLAQPWPGGVR